VLYLPLAGMALPGQGTASSIAANLRQQDGPWILSLLVGLPGQLGAATGVNVMPDVGPNQSAQLAVVDGLVRALGLARSGALSAGIQRGMAPGSPQELAAAQRFAALPAAARRAWLMTHLAALRAGRISLSEIP